MPPDRETPSTPRDRLDQFIGRLIDGYRRLHGSSALPAAEVARVEQHAQSLMLARGAIHYAQRGDDWPMQIAILGPTQTGKSTIANLLLGATLAEVSPLAGFTVHAQGFAAVPAGVNDAWRRELFPDWQPTPLDCLDSSRVETYALHALNGVAAERWMSAFPTRGCVFWDTPDFDSLAARAYARGVLEVAALADVHLFVLSKEKYSDLSVWRMLDLVAPLGRPLAICLNKLTPDAEDTIVASIRKRLSEHGAGNDVRLIVLPYDPGLPEAGEDGGHRAIEQLRSVMTEAIRERRAHRAEGASSLLRSHWDEWLAPVRAEHAAIAEWRQLVDEACGQFVEAYERDYLDHPERYDAFRRAALELLELLELPKIGAMMARARYAITWPARQVLAAGRSWWRDRSRPRTTLHSLGAESGVLVDTLDTLLTVIEREVSRRCAHGSPAGAIWTAIADRLESRASELRETFESAIRRHHEEVNAEVRAAARRLYEELQQHPTRLHALRTARTTIDVGYLLLAIKTGGLTPIDAVWAPATFGLTSLLMEGMTGLEMQREAYELKQKQRARVRDEVVDGVLCPMLHAQAEDLDAVGVFGISAVHVEEAEQSRKQWEVAGG